MEHNRDKYPEVWARMEAFRKIEAEILSEREPLLAEMREIELKREKLKAKKDALNEQAMARIDELAEARREISRCARYMDSPQNNRG